MTDFYALKRYHRTVDWSMVWFWASLWVFGVVEVGLAIYGAIHLALRYKEAFVQFLQKVGLGG